MRTYLVINIVNAENDLTALEKYLLQYACGRNRADFNLLKFLLAKPHITKLNAVIIDPANTEICPANNTDEELKKPMYAPPVQPEHMEEAIKEFFQT